MYDDSFQYIRNKIQYTNNNKSYYGMGTDQCKNI